MALILTSFSSLTFCLTLHHLSFVLSFPWIHPSSSPAAFLWAHIFCLVWQMYCDITKLFWMVLIRMFLSFPYLLGFWRSSSHPLSYCTKAWNENDQGFPSSSKYSFCLSQVQNIKSRTASFCNQTAYPQEVRATNSSSGWNIAWFCIPAGFFLFQCSRMLCIHLVVLCTCIGLKCLFDFLHQNKFQQAIMNVDWAHFDSTPQEVLFRCD